MDALRKSCLLRHYWMMCSPDSAQRQRSVFEKPCDVLHAVCLSLTKSLCQAKVGCKNTLGLTKAEVAKKLRAWRTRDPPLDFLCPVVKSTDMRFVLNFYRVRNHRQNYQAIGLPINIHVHYISNKLTRRYFVPDFQQSNERPTSQITW